MSNASIVNFFQCRAIYKSTYLSMKYPNLAILTALSLVQVMTTPPATASLFQQTEVNQDNVIAIASPIGNTRHQLLILEQLSSSRNCWAENGDRVTPLLLDFDFTGICSRATDSNGYSVRVGNEDLGFQYSLRLAAENGILRLLASSNRNLSAPPIEVGRATLQPGEFVSVTLNPGWRITKRTYNGQPLGHYYLANDQPLSALLPSSSSPSTFPSPEPIAIQPTPTPSPLPTISQPEPIPSAEPINVGSDPTPLSPSTPIAVQPSEPIPIVVQPVTPIPAPATPITVGSDPTPLSSPIPIAVQPVAPTPPTPTTGDPDLSPVPIAVQPAPTPSASTSLYQKVEIDPTNVVAIASPVGGTGYQLVIVEQLSSTQDCWTQEGDRVTPLLLDFDFIGICDRAAGSSGYSVRVADEDLGFQYGVRLVSDNDTLRLLASSTRDLSAPAIEIGRATLQPGEFVAVTLNPGWRMTKRSYNGQEVRHYYFTNDQPLSALFPGNSAPSSPSPVPTTSAPIPLSSPPSPAPTASQPPPALSPTQVLPFPPEPSPTDVSSLPTVIVPAVIPRAGSIVPAVTPRSSTAAPAVIPSSTPVPLLAQSRSIYRVTIPTPTLALQERVRDVVPDAFRRVVNGEVVMQVGVFSDRQTAVEFQAQLQRDGLTAIIQQEAVR
ncbi:MAG: DUF3747 domain-containing protein [Cyanobacteria bacterium P01_E01_bin.6]